MASQFLIAAMATLAILVAVVFIVAVWAATRSRITAAAAALGLIALMAAQHVAAAAGLPREWERRPPPLFLLLAGMLALTIGLAYSRLGAKLAERTTFALLVGSQVFRLPLELTMHRAASEDALRFRETAHRSISAARDCSMP